MEGENGGGAYLVDLRQHLNLWSMQDSQRQRYHLQILAPGRGGDVAGFGADIVDDGFLEPRDQEMGALIHDVFLDS